MYLETNDNKLYYQFFDNIFKEVKYNNKKNEFLKCGNKKIKYIFSDFGFNTNGVCTENLKYSFKFPINPVDEQEVVC